MSCTVENVSTGSDILLSLLTNWQCEELYENFVDAEIDIMLFLDIDLQTLNFVLPEKTIGYKLKLLQKIKEVKSTLSTPDLITVETTDTSNPVIVEVEAPPTQKDLCRESKQSTSQSPKKRRCDEKDPDYDPEKESSSDSFEMDEPLSTVKARCKRANTANSTETSDKPEGNRLVNPNLFAAKKVATQSFLQELNNLDLEELLKDSLEGRAILNSYKTVDRLEEEERNALVDILVKWLLLKCVHPKKVEFTILKDKIITLFPNEINVYYIAPKEEGDHQTLARGKLFDRTRNVKDWMRRKGLLAKAEGKKKLVNPDKDEDEELDLNIELTEDIKDALDWLKVMREPWDKVTEKWALTSKYRISCLLNSRVEGENGKKGAEKASKYVDTYKVIMGPQGYQLIAIDFQARFGEEKSNGLVELWPKVKDIIVKLIKETPSLVKDPEGKELAKRLLKCSNEDSMSVLIFKLLFSLVPPTRKVKVGKKSVKPSIKDSRESFITRVNTANLVSNRISEVRTETMKEFGQNATVQPYILYVGTEDDKVSKFYVIIDNFAYKLTNLVQAVDVCFKSFFAIDMEYSPQSQHIWLLIQKLFYKITTDDDLKILNVKSFVNKIEILMSNNES